MTISKMEGLSLWRSYIWAGHHMVWTLWRQSDLGYSSQAESLGTVDEKGQFQNSFHRGQGILP